MWDQKSLPYLSASAGHGIFKSEDGLYQMLSSWRELSAIVCIDMGLEMRFTTLTARSESACLPGKVSVAPLPILEQALLDWRHTSGTEQLELPHGVISGCLFR